MVDDSSDVVDFEEVSAVVGISVDSVTGNDSEGLDVVVVWVETLEVDGLLVIGGVTVVLIAEDVLMVGMAVGHLVVVLSEVLDEVVISGKSVDIEGSLEASDGQK